MTYLVAATFLICILGMSTLEVMGQQEGSLEREGGGHGLGNRGRSLDPLDREGGIILTPQELRLGRPSISIKSKEEGVSDSPILKQFSSGSIQFPTEPMAAEGNLVLRQPDLTKWQNYKSECGPHAGKYIELLKKRNKGDTVNAGEYRTALKNYDLHCLEKPTALPARVKNYLYDLIGVLVVPNPNGSMQVCAGTRIASKRIVTARHCAFTEGPKGTFSQNALTNGWKGSFYLASNPGVGIPTGDVSFPPDLLNAATQFHSSDYKHDYIMIDLPSLNLAMPKVAPKDAVKGDLLQMLAFQVDVYTLLVEPSAKTFPTNWTEAIRLDRAASCQAVERTTSGCVLHGCQARVGMSGAILFTQAEEPENIKMAAIHSRSIEPHMGQSCDNTEKPNIPNVAISLSAGVQSQMGR